MKVKSFPAPRLAVASVAQGRTILRGAWSLFCARKWLPVALFVFALGLAAAVWPHDRALLARLHELCGRHDSAARRLAWYLGTWGDYPTYNVPVALAIWMYGAATRSSAWRRTAVIAFLGASLAGLFDDFFRLTLGRPRPDSHLPDGFYGITHAFRGGFQSFPSGHAASVFGTALALLVTDLPLGLLTFVIALAVVWGRMELERHYPTDVIVGMAIGTYFGLLCGLGAKVRRNAGPAPATAKPASDIPDRS